MTIPSSPEDQRWPAVASARPPRQADPRAHRWEDAGWEAVRLLATTGQELARTFALAAEVPPGFRATRLAEKLLRRCEAR